MTYEELLSKYGWIEEHRLSDGGIWFSHSTKGSIIIDPERRWEWTRPDNRIVKGFNPRDLEKALFKSESITKVKRIFDLLEQTQTLGPYMDSYQSLFSPSDWQKIVSLLRRIVGIPFYQFNNSVSDDMLNTLAKQNVPGNTIGQETYFFYYNGVQNSKPYVIGGFGDAAEEPPKYLMIRKSDQIKWQEEFKGQLEDYNRLNLPTQDFPPVLKVSIGEPVGGHDKRSQEGISYKMGGGRAGWSKKQDLITRIQLLLSNLNPELGIEGIRKETSFYRNKSVEELESIHKELFNQAKEKGLIKNRGESLGVAEGGYGKPVHAFSGTVNYMPQPVKEKEMGNPHKQPWEMTQREFLLFQRQDFGKDWVVAYEIEVPREHKYLVQQALSQGKPVPREVLKDYPDLTTKSGESLSKAKKFLNLVEAEKIDFECMECGKKFKSSNTDEPKCPKCGGYDVEPL